MDNNNLWIKEVENPILKPLNDWREELYGYYMVVTDTSIVDGIENTIARYYGTDSEKIYDKCEEFWDAKKHDAQVYFNKKSNWMGGVFIAKTES